VENAGLSWLPFWARPSRPPTRPPVHPALEVVPGLSLGPASPDPRPNQAATGPLLATLSLAGKKPALCAQPALRSAVVSPFRPGWRVRFPVPPRRLSDGVSEVLIARTGIPVAVPTLP